MKKIVTAFYAIDTPWHVINFAARFAKEQSAAIHAIFLKADKENFNADYPFPNDLSITEPDTAERISDSNNELIDKNIQLFKEECELAGIPFSALKNLSVQELIDETTDANLMVADSRSDLLKKILPRIHCPVFLASEDELPQKVVLMYHNSASAKLAIEDYLSLLPQFKNLPTYLLSVNPEKSGEKEMEIYFKEKLEPHFTNIILKTLHGNREQEMKNFLSELQSHIIVVMGAFGRSASSGLFHQSLANVALSEKNISLFIAHK